MQELDIAGKRNTSVDIFETSTDTKAASQLPVTEVKHEQISTTP
jgi:hypothetical protein